MPAELAASLHAFRPAATLTAAHRMPGGASTRTYDRVTVEEHGRLETLVVMGLHEEPGGAAEVTSGPAPDELPFVALARYLSAAGVRVPVVHHYDEPGGLVWLEDLGDRMLRDVVLPAADDERLAWYRRAIDVLVEFQRATERRPQPAPICFHRRFERSLLRWELDHYREWRLEQHLGLTLAGPFRDALDREFDAVVERIATAPVIVVHRDFQSTNLMVPPDDRLALLDFQDALLGPYTYDLVSLLRDSYVQLRPPEVDTLIGHYLERRPDLDPDAFRAAFHLQTVQRKLKDAGRFVFIDRVKKNPRFLPNITPSLGYVKNALGHVPGLERLAGLLAEVDPLLRP